MICQDSFDEIVLSKSKMKDIVVVYGLPSSLAKASVVTEVARPWLGRMMDPFIST